MVKMLELYTNLGTQLALPDCLGLTFSLHRGVELASLQARVMDKKLAQPNLHLMCVVNPCG